MGLFQPCVVLGGVAPGVNVTVFFGHAAVNAAVCFVFFSRIKLLLDVLMKEILHPESQSPDGVKFHFIGIYLDELSKVGGREVRSRLPASGSDTAARLVRTLALPHVGLEGGGQAAVGTLCPQRRSHPT